MAFARLTSAGPSRASALSPAAQRLRLLQPRVRALERQLSFELRHGREDIKDEPAPGRGGVDRLGEHLQPDLALLQVGRGLHQLAHRAR